MGKKARKQTVSNEVSQLLPRALSGLGIDLAATDLVLVGDGSGNGWGTGCGWSVIVIDVQRNLRKLVVGGSNVGTSYIAEVVPYVFALSWYHSQHGKEVLRHKLRTNPTAQIVVHLVTDSEMVAKQGQRQCRHKAGDMFWAALHAIEGLGFSLRWHWLTRNTLDLNRLCDYLAGESRRAVNALETVKPPSDTSIYDFNPLKDA